jgi:hypothetical protein
MLHPHYKKYQYLHLIAGFGSGSVSGSGSAWIRINLSCWIRIRIQIADPKPWLIGTGNGFLSMVAHLLQQGSKSNIQDPQHLVCHVIRILFSFAHAQLSVSDNLKVRSSVCMRI